MSENKHEPDEARENETRSAGAPEGAVAGDVADTTEVIENLPTPDPESTDEAAGPVEPATATGPGAGPGAEPGAEPAGSAGPPERSVPETEEIGIGRNGDPAAAGGSGVDPADVPPGQPASVHHGAPGQASGQGAPPATAVQTVQHPNVPPRPAPPQGPRVGTVVWGLVVLAIGLGVLAASAGARIDVSLAAILLLGGAGVALVAGSIVSSFRRRGEP
ncbi:hypothetical protein GCM10027059_08480 [Myceligenerans halotolerans]